MSFEAVYDVIVVGGGNAGFTAAITAAQSGARRVLLVEKAPEECAGGNTYYTVAGFRCCFDGLSDLLPFLHQSDGTRGLPQDLVDKIEMAPYTKTDFHADISRVTKGRADPALAKVLVDNSRAGVQWLVDNGAKFMLSFNRQAFEVEGRFKFWGGMVMNMIGQGKELCRLHIENAHRHGVNIAYSTPAVSLIVEPGGTAIQGVSVLTNGHVQNLKAVGGVILASGGFQASPAMRARYLGPGWDLAHVRGCKYNTGDGHRIAHAAGAQLAGNYSGCHAVAWDRNAPVDEGSREITNQYTKSGYPLGLMLNIEGKRFVDEGFDLRNFTYAVFGKEILKQPSGIAFQIWDKNQAKWLRKEEYADDVTKNIRAQSLEEMASKLTEKGLKDPQQFLSTIREYNQAVHEFQKENPDVRFDPAIRDGKSTQSSKVALTLGKTNWATPCETGPFQAVEVTTGITFTFGGLKVQPQTGNVVSEATRQPIAGLYCTGEILGDLFWDNYPGGSGLMMGTVMGRITGKEAAARARQNEQQIPCATRRSRL